MKPLKRIDFWKLNEITLLKLWFSAKQSEGISSFPYGAEFALLMERQNEKKSFFFYITTEPFLQFSKITGIFLKLKDKTNYFVNLKFNVP